jgi:hypothetical protein
MASYFVYLSELDDLAPNATVSIAGGFSYQPGFPFSNVLTSKLHELWLSQTITGGAGYDGLLAINLGAPTPWNLLVLGNNNIPETTTIRVQTGTTSSVLDHNDLMTWREFDQYFLTSDRTDQYIRIRLTDASIPDGFILYMGKIKVGQGTAAPKTFRNGWMRCPMISDRRSQSDLDTESVDIIRAYEQFTFDFANLSVSERTTFMTFLETLKGSKYHFFLITDTSEYKGHFVALQATPRERRGIYTDLDQITVNEKSRGVRAGA